MKNKCIKCGKSYNSLADGICFFCDKKKWEAHFNKFAGKNRK